MHSMLAAGKLHVLACAGGLNAWIVAHCLFTVHAGDLCFCLQTGFMSTTKKGSIFAVPDGPGGKVGVVGSGKPMTQEPTRPRHDFGADST
jgi:hypothetical protein